MKQILLAITIMLLSLNAPAQVLKKLGDRAKQKLEQKAGDKVDKAVDDAVDGKKDNNNQNNSNGNSADTDSNTEENTKKEVKPENLKAYSKYDFVPGEKIVSYEDFTRTDIGDFPTNWNTNATAEVVTLNKKEGKWLKINKEGVWLPEFINTLPDNFTLEFDLGVSNDFDGSVFNVNIANLKNRDQDYTDFYHYVNWRHGHALHMEFKPSNGRGSAHAQIQAATDGNYQVNNNVEFSTWNNEKANFAHISLWRQNQRLRIYVNGEKIFDIPKAFQTGGKYNMVNFAMQGSYKPDEYHYYLSNIRLAVGAPDTRNKLMTEGKFVTRGILFDTNSDKLKPESYGALKDISNVLKENPGIKVKIVGHTDADGDEKSNLDLSKRRAAAVKAALIKEVGVAGDNLETDGKGEAEPVDKNPTAEGKANNRRVEFIKL